LLVLYDASRCPAERAHADHQAFIDRLAEPPVSEKLPRG
jgi:hypothetical protein